MQTTDTGLLFQTTDQISDGKRHAKKLVAAAKVGSPILINGKIIDFVIYGSTVLIAESGWQARHLCLKTGKTLRLFKGHKGPVTCIAIWNDQWILTGSWDKAIKIWDIKTGENVHTVEIHTDFVKSLTILPSSLLLSTSSDRSLRLWDLSPLISGQQPRSIQQIKEHSRPVDCATYAMISDQVTVWTGDSMGVINEWTLRDKRLELVKRLEGHETAITGLSPAEDGLWSASMDKTAIFHPFSGEAATTIPHSSYVNSILSLPSEYVNGDLVITGSDDEDLRIWDPSRIAKPKSIIQGHCGAILAIRWWREEGVLITGSLDGTLRRWTLEDLKNGVVLDYNVEEEKEEVGLTEDEERELAELMDSD